MPRPRSPKNRGLPPNLYEHLAGSYRYKRPDGCFVYLGHNRPAAIQAAIGANAHFAAKTSLFDKIVAGEHKTLSGLIDDYLEQKLPKADVSDKTRDNRRWSLQAIQRAPIAGKAIAELATRDLHLYLESVPSDWSKQNRRTLLMQLCKWAVQIGLREDNPASALDSPTATRKRERLDYQVYVQLHALAPTWLQNAMDLQLQTLQRPGDVIAMRWDQIKDGHLHLVQQKTGKRLRLKIEGPVSAVLARCRDQLLSPFLVHRRPDRIKAAPNKAAKRVHHTQVILKQAQREFALVRERSGLFTANDNPPTLHEIRSLGASLYRQAGWSEEEVQRLLGHSEVRMTRHYLNGHELPWDEVSAGLKLP